ncbi:MAG: hypothetical protein NZZ60_04435 [Bacteroidia bacterium]|nr:hypothetical protein [Bacteroidia bacterium]MCX7651378.1 hypothetical protein [Bacteroidia bacterium]MDW8416722.1 hypothetical protein [Bacteroidia bacterium]
MALRLKVSLIGPILSLVFGQRLLVGPTGKDTVLPAGKVIVRYVAPPGWQRDTFILVVRNALGIVHRGRLLPHSNAVHQAELNLSKSGFFVLLVYHPRAGGRIWASHRLYLLSPPHTTVAHVRAYHNALLAKKPSPIQSLSTNLPEDLEPLTEPFSDAAPLPAIDIEAETESILIDEPTQGLDERGDEEVLDDE